MKPAELFVQDVCRFSNMGKHFLRTHDVPHNLHNTSTDLEARRDFLRLGAEMLPVLIVDGRIYEGFHPHLWRMVVAKAFGIVVPIEDLKVYRFKFHNLLRPDPVKKKKIVPMYQRPTSIQLPLVSKLNQQPKPTLVIAKR